MAAGVTDRIMKEDAVSLIDAANPIPAVRGPYKKRGICIHCHLLRITTLKAISAVAGIVLAPDTRAIRPQKFQTETLPKFRNNALCLLNKH